MTQLCYYKAIRKRLAKKRAVIRAKALEAERIIQGPDPFEMRCERPGCGHAKRDHAALVDGTRGQCWYTGCECSDYYLGPPT